MKAGNSISVPMRCMALCLVSLMIAGIAYGDTAQTVQAGALPAKKTTPQQLYLTSQQAYDMVSASPEEGLFIDIRTRSEVTFVGMPEQVDFNIPFMFEGDWQEWDDEKETYKLAYNKDFIYSIRKAIEHKGSGKDKETRIILMCRSGKRSAQAARILHIAGYRNVYTVVDGFEGDKLKSGEKAGQRLVNGWKNNGLPWSYRLDREKLL
ncbi:MAG: rhodanese-like domain-containing protein [Gammaproteobacteria bacterium]